MSAGVLQRILKWFSCAKRINQYFCKPSIYDEVRRVLESLNFAFFWLDGLFIYKKVNDVNIWQQKKDKKFDATKAKNYNIEMSVIKHGESNEVPVYRKKLLQTRDQ